MKQNKIKETNKYVNFNIPDKCKYCTNNCEVLKYVSEYEIFPDPDLIDLYCTSPSKIRKD